MMLRLILWAGLSALVSGASFAQVVTQPIDNPGPARVRVPRFDPGLGRGVNFGNMLEAPNEGDWGLSVQEVFFDKVVEAGLGHIRLPINWTNHASHQPPYTIDPVYMSRVDWCVDQALARNLKIIVNVHHYDQLNVDPVAEHDRAIAIWNQIATNMQDRSASVVFEVLNEPHGAFSENPQLWNDYLADAVAVIRQTNPTRWVMAGPVSWNSIGALGSFDPPADARLIASVHFYEPFGFTHQGATWVDPPPPVGVSWTGDEYTVGRPWQNWSWGTTVTAAADGLDISYQQGWGGFYLRRGSALAGVDRIVFRVDAAQNFNVIFGTDANEVSQVVQTGAGGGEYTVVVPAGGPAIEKVILQNATPNAAGPIRVSSVRLEWDGGAKPEEIVVTQAGDVDSAMRMAADWAAARRVPMYLGEFGAFSAAAMPDRARWTRAVREAAEAHGIGWGYWELAAGFGFYDPDADAWRVPLLEALTK